MKSLGSLFLRNRKKKGLKFAVRAMLLRILGIDETISTLQYFLNELHTPSSVGTAKDPDLRILQQCDAQLLAIFHRFCMKHNLTYWIDYGTLLGAVRHGGFIPWDDDMDVAMPRDDYQRFLELAKIDLIPLGFNVEELQIGRLIGFSYNHLLTGIWLDIFPIDSVKSDLSVEETESIIARGFKKFRKCYARYEKKHDRSLLSKKRKEMIDDKIPLGDKYIISFHGPEFVYSKILIHDNTDIFPLHTIPFEGYDLFCPCHVDNYLKRIYSSNYMHFPVNGVLHHGEASGRPPLSTWAKIHNIDMNEVLEELTRLADSI